jgi:hypothetical protein
MFSYTYVDVQPGDNTPMSANQVFKNLSEPVRIGQVRLFEGEPDGTLFSITGWSRDGPCDVYAVRVEDSSAGAAYLIFGGDQGVRLRPVDSTAPWSLEDPDQYGETHLVLADMTDIVTA